MAKSDQPTVSEMVDEARTMQRAEEEALHVMGVVPIILEASVILPVICLVAAVLVALFR